jgi:hypothetical protein
MAALTIRCLNALRTPLEDVVDIVVSAVRSSSEIARAKNHDGRKRLRVPNLTAHEPYLVQVFPMRHRPVGQFVIGPAGDKPAAVDLYCPVDPMRATARFPDYLSLDPALLTVLERSTLERDPASPPLPAALTPGKAIYDSLAPTERAGLLNLFCKMRHVPLGDLNTWSHVKDVYRVRGDRIFANVTLEFRDRVKNAVSGGAFTVVDGSLHHPPTDFEHAGSFKTLDRYGNLQLTFFGSSKGAPEFRVDADVDNAAGIEHAFQVLAHFFTRGATHPFDIHQILTFFQRLPASYDLVV